MLDRGDAELDVVQRRRFFRSDVRCRAQVLQARFLHGCDQLVAVHGDDLQPVGAAARDVADPFPDFVWPSVGPLGDDRVDQDPR
jgi:hypothetical protein